MKKTDRNLKGSLKRHASKQAAQWKSLASGQWLLGHKAMKELKILIRLAGQSPVRVPGRG